MLRPRTRRGLPTTPLPATASVPTMIGRVSAADVDRAADSLLREGQRPTIEKVRLKIGHGSPNTINPLLDAWWSRLAGRLDAGPAALHRLPEAVLHAAEGLWLAALDDARRRAQAEQGSTRATLARERQELTVRSHVLSIRESELQSRLEQAERRSEALQLEVETLTTLLRKEQAARQASARSAVALGARSPLGKRNQPAARAKSSGRVVRKSARAHARRRG